MALLTEELRALVGRQAVYVSPEEFGLAAGRYFARAVGDDNPLYTSTEAARAVGLPGPVLPPTLLFETNSYTDLPRDDEGFAGHSWGVSPYEAAIPTLGSATCSPGTGSPRPGRSRT